MIERSSLLGGAEEPRQPCSSHDFSRLLRLRTSLLKAGSCGQVLAGPFIPFVGSSYFSDRGPRLMVVGKATARDYGRWGPFRLWDWTKWTQQMVLEGDVPTSGFWSFAERLVHEVHARFGIGADGADSWRWAMERLVWTNLCKLGTVEGNPNAELRRNQRSLALQMLRGELQRFKPTGVVLVTGTYWQDFASEAFLPRGVRIRGGVEIGDLTSTNERPGGRFYRTRHPERWLARERNRAIRLIAEDQWHFVSRR